ncbi:MAG: RNA methyltransferase [Chloroflexota bacterium]
MLPIITSLQNPQIKNLVKLRQRRQRDRQKRMLIDGIRPLTLALRNNFPIETLYYCEDRVSLVLLELARSKDTRLQPVSEMVFQKIGYGDNPDGHLGLAGQPDFNLSYLPTRSNPLFLIAEGLEKPGNLGAILRSADAAGISGLIVCNSQTDIYNPNVIRASQGAFFSVPIAVEDREKTFKWLREQGIQVYAAAPDAEQSYSDVNLTIPTALVVGTEADGLSDDWFSFDTVSIPMHGQVDSLNVAQTATLLMFEAIRQRDK